MAPAPEEKPRTFSRRRWVLRLAALLVAGLALLLWATRQRSQKVLTIENRSGEPVAFLQVTVAGETTTFRDVPSGAARTAPFGTSGEDLFVVEGELKGKTKIHGNGTATEGLTLIILPEGKIEFRPRRS
jgi:hypothetical protein